MPYTEKEIWFEASEGGKSVADLARDYRKDPRTVRRGIEEVRNRRLTAQVRVQRLRDAIGRHHDDLLNVVAGAAKSIGVPPVHIESVYTGRPTAEIGLSGATAVVSDSEFLDVRLEVEEGLRWRLLKAHLPNHRAYVFLDRWKTAVLAEFNDRLRVRAQVSSKLVEEIGVSIDNDSSRPGTVTQLLIHNMSRAAVSRALLESPVYSLSLTAEESGQFVDEDGRVCGRLEGVGQGEKLEAIRRLPVDIASGELGVSLAGHHAEVAVLAGKASEGFEVIHVSYYLDGTCAACSRYGV